MTVAADPGIVRFGDEGGERAGDDGVDRVAALLQRVEPGLDGDRVSGGYHAAGRAYLAARAEHRTQLLRYRHRLLAQYKQVSEGSCPPS